MESFLLALGVSPDNAPIDAEGIEHHVVSQTLAAFQAALGAGLDEFIGRARG